MNSLDKIVDIGKKIVAGLSFIALTSCSPTYAKRDYGQYPEYRGEIAYYNVTQILSSLCSKKDFWINNKGFNCTQLDIYGNYHTTQFRWDEINAIACHKKFYMQVEISGEYDFGTVFTSPKRQQCDDLQEAMQIFLEERKK